MKRAVLYLAAAWFLTASVAEAVQSRNRASSLLQRTTAIKLTDGRIVNGRVVGFSKNGLVFDEERSGPFYDPPPRTIPFSAIQVLLDRNGKPLWKNPRTPSRPPRRTRFRAMVGLEGGVGRYLKSYRAPTVSADPHESIGSVLDVGVEVMYFSEGRYLAGLVFQQQTAGVDYIKLSYVPQQPPISHDVYRLQMPAFKGAVLQPLSKKTWLHLDFAAGRAQLSSDGKFLSPPQRIKLSATVLSAGAGIDWFIDRQISVGAGFSFLFGSAEKAEFDDRRIGFRHSLNRFTTMTTVRYWF